MNKRHYRSALKYARQTAEMNTAAQQVIAHRMTRMLTAGATPSARDRAEFQRMFTEKGAALVEAQMQMAQHWMRMHQALAADVVQTWSAWWAAPLSLSTPGARHSATAFANAMTRSLSPFHRRAVANAKRLHGKGRRK